MLAGQEASMDGAAFGTFDYKISGKTADTRGLFVSIHGYSPTAITALNGKGALRFVCIDGAHLMRATELSWDMPRLLRIVWRHADETGEAYPLRRSTFEALARRGRDRSVAHLLHGARRVRLELRGVPFGEQGRAP
jgi:hypothetical protein